ncbi:MAG TPA: flagellar export protein FliJ [Thermodesulfobacteriota bacterium]|nr:flagellar export protein FliJ [Deltaproteobacteria bacterium]HNR13746.1 flagellar export protein FliJ [Thermodesulfobacteriota bacterium]HNU70133.1 flagellar export protein FliJ [Thermodesulfobacteriota bacterium]HOC38012.1 flagellar export protein FliJ [Thermodesulfobacteriota bacterium]
MAVYRFALESLLGHRKFTEELFQKELAVLVRRFLEEQEDLLNLGRVRDSLVTAFELKQREAATISELLVYTTFLERVSKEFEKKSEQVAALESTISAKRNDLLEAMKKRKTLDRLKEKGLKAFIHEENSQEQKFINEVAIGQYCRKG